MAPYNSEFWKCEFCTFMNTFNQEKCKLCGRQHASDQKNDILHFDETGIVYNIATENGMKSWINPGATGKIKVEFSSIGVYSDPAHLIFDESSYCSMYFQKNCRFKIL